MKLVPFLALAFSVVFAGCTKYEASPQEIPEKSMEKSGLTVRMDQKKGLTIKDEKIGDVSMVSRIIAVEPPWLEKWFWNQTSELDFVNQGKFTEMKQKNENEKFRILEYSAAANGDTVTVKFSAELREDVPAVLEYSAINVADILLAGGNYVATKYDGAVVTGKISRDPTNSTAPFISNAKKIEFTGDYGTVIIEVKKGTLLDVVDRRGAEFEHFRCFWIAKNEIPLKYGEKFDSEIDFTFTFNPTAVMAEKLPNLLGNSKPQMINIPDLKSAYIYNNVPISEYTIPQKISVRGFVPQPAIEKIEIIGEVDKVDKSRLEKAFDELKTKISVPDARVLKIVIGNEYDKFVAPTELDGYFINSSDNEILILARTPRAAFYAIQTMRDTQLLRKRFQMTDYPDMDFRGIHLLAAEETPTFHKFLVEEIFNRGKINYIVLECEYVKWDATEKLWQPNSLSKEGLREFLQVCKDNYIEVIPLFQTLGHCEWLFKNGQNIEWAEDPASPYAYNVSAPGVYPFMDSVLDEVIEAFNPKYIHIGHDEVDMIGRYPYQPENIERGIVDLVRSDIMHYYNYLKERGIQLMMWHDMIVTNEECSNGSGMRQKEIKSFRDTFPKDIIIADWQYTGDDRYAHFKDVKMLMDEGFTVIGCTWYEENNIENFATAVKKYGAWGLMQTTWTGYFSGWNSFDENFYQIAPYLRAAAWSWNVTEENKRRYGNYHQKLSDLLLLTPPCAKSPEVASGKLVNISSVANVEISSGNNPFSLGSDLGIGSHDTFKSGEIVQVGNVKFLLPERDGKLAAVTLRSLQNRSFPDDISITLNTRASKIYLLNVNIGPLPRFDQLVAHVEMCYTDGTSTNVPLIYNRNIGGFYGPSSKDLNISSRFTFNDGGSIWYTEITNPLPDKEIAKLNIISDGLPYYLFGISLED